ncbi:hypothetical protein Tco_1251585 [Tanacetum coccineum]
MGPTDGANEYAKRGTYQAPMRIEYLVVKVSLHTLVMASLFIGRDASTLRLRGGAFYGTFDRAFNRAFEGPSTGPSTGPSRRRPGVFSELNRGRKRRLHPLGEYIITLYTNGKLCTRVMVTLRSRAEGTDI